MTKKTSRDLIDPELIQVADLLTTFSSQVTLETLPAVREQFMLMSQESAPAEHDIAVEKTVELVPGPKGAPDVRVLTYRPASAASLLPIFFHAHGGGYVLGAADINDAQSRNIAEHVNCMVISVDYRLAPETRAPGAVEDCYAALEWLHANADRLGVDTNRIALGGESAGGGLAAAFALYVRDRGEFSFCHQSLDAPMLDDRIAVSSDPHPYTGEFVWTNQMNRLGWQALLGCEPGSPDVSPYASAARAEDLSGLPPAFICVGGLDLFMEESIEYARRLSQAGGLVELHVYPGAVHGFQANSEAYVAKEALRARWQALSRALNGR